MRRYETIFILNPELSDEEYTKLNQKFQSIISSFGGQFLGFEDWGRRKLAYDVKKFNKGYYFVFDFAGDAATVNELERNLKIDEKVIRYQTVKIEDRFDYEKFLLEKEKKKASEIQRKAPEEYDPNAIGRRDTERDEGFFESSEDSFEENAHDHDDEEASHEYDKSK